MENNSIANDVFRWNEVGIMFRVSLAFFYRVDGVDVVVGIGWCESG